MRLPNYRTVLASLTLHTVHYFASLRSALALFWGWTLSLLFGLLKHKGSKSDLIQKDAKLLEKIPYHLAFVVTEKEIRCDYLVQLISWSFLSGVQYVSVFDQKGELKRDITKLRESVNDKYHSLVKSDSTLINVITPGDINVNAPTTNTGLWLLVLSSDDGRDSIASVARSLCEEARHSSVIPTIDISTISSRMTMSNIVPDPDLAIVCGSTKSLLGYPPWTSPLTEIMWLSSHYKCSYFEFHSLLYRYAQSQQRYGK